MNLRKFQYYVTNGLFSIIPSVFFRLYAKKIIIEYKKKPQKEIEERVNYYNKLLFNQSLSQFDSTISNFKKTGGSAYYYDLLKVIKGFKPDLKFSYINGDVITVPDQPSFLKSRPIEGENKNSVLLKLNAIRHFVFVKDDKTFQQKNDLLVWRGSGFRPNRRLLLELFFHHPRCNVARVDKQDKDQLQYIRPKMSIQQQLDYKFILSLEGKDVATNLKWIMSSNSLCLTPKLKYETWFMEGLLQPGVHYVEIKDDYSDLMEKMDYYIAHPDEAEKIIKNAHAWVTQFMNPERERLISLLVAQKYFKLCS